MVAYVVRGAIKIDVNVRGIFNTLRLVEDICYDRHGQIPPSRDIRQRGKQMNGVVVQKLDTCNLVINKISNAVNK